MTRCIRTGFLAALLLLGLTAQPALAQDARAGIDAGNAALRAAVRADDAKALSELYTVDAVAFPPGAPPASGRAEIAAFWQAGIEGGMADVELTTKSVESQGNLAVEDGTVKLTAADGSVSSSRYVVVWKLEDGRWKLHRDIWNSGP